MNDHTTETAVTGEPKDAPGIRRRTGKLRDTYINLAHGSGGKAMRDLIEDIFVGAFDNPVLAAMEDQAVFPLAELARHGDRLAFTTDTFVVDPLFFPGGDIGTLAVAGTVNDLAMSGAKPLYLSCGFVLEEGLSVDTLRRVVTSMQRTALSPARSSMAWPVGSTVNVWAASVTPSRATAASTVYKPASCAKAAGNASAPPAGSWISRYRAGARLTTGDCCPHAWPMSTRTVASPTCSCGMASAGVCTKLGSASSASTGSAAHS